MTIETSPSSSTSSTDQALLTEISPAMMQKLRRAWRRRKAFLGLLFLLGGLHLLRQTEPFTIFNETWLTIFGVSNLLFGIAFFCVALFDQTLGLQEELKFRRQHGKWRWDR